MGYMCSHAIVVSGELKDEVAAAHERAITIFPWVLPISPPAVNVNRSFFIPPDGSKEFWPESDKGDKRRAAFVEYLKGRMLDWVEVQYADDEGHSRVVHSSGLEF